MNKLDHTNYLYQCAAALAGDLYTPSEAFEIRTKNSVMFGKEMAEHIRLTTEKLGLQWEVAKCRACIKNSVEQWRNVRLTVIKNLLELYSIQLCFKEHQNHRGRLLLKVIEPRDRDYIDMLLSEVTNFNQLECAIRNWESQYLMEGADWAHPEDVINVIADWRAYGRRYKSSIALRGKYE